MKTEDELERERTERLRDEFIKLPVEDSQQKPLPKSNPDYLDDDYFSDLLKEVEATKKPFEELGKNYFIDGKKIVEVHCNGETFAIKEASKDFIQREFMLSKDEIEAFLNYLVRNKKLPPYMVKHIGDIFSDKIRYDYNQAKAEFTVYYPGIKTNIKDNDFIESYLENTFGEHKAFIKNYLAVYTHSNYKKLPTICLTGGRGTGKNTFAESLLASIFPALSVTNPDLKSPFNGYLVNKLIVIDESNEGAREQYNTLKKNSGQTNFRINPKFKEEYSTPNNINTIILSNDQFFIYVARNEMPTNESNNQFFVFEMKPPKFFNTNLMTELKERLGYYCRTELKKVYDSLDFNGKRYSINTPITNEEIFLFSNSFSDNELVTEEVTKELEKLFEENNDTFYKAYRDGLLPSQVLKELVMNVKNGLQVKHASYNKVVQLLRINGVIQKTGQIRKNYDGKKMYFYEVTEKLTTLLTKNLDYI